MNIEASTLALSSAPQQTLHNTEALRKGESFQAILHKLSEEKDEKRLKEACQDLEAVFVYQLLEQMRASVPKGELLPEGQAEKIYRGMLDEEYSKLIAKSPQNFGLANMLYRQLSQDIKIQDEQLAAPNDQHPLAEG